VTGTPRRSHVWDCFFLNQELDLLEFRLRELSNVVDRFIVVEADRTFSGVEKPLYFRENRERFADFADRVTVVTVNLTPDGVTRWDRENEQRRALAPIVECVDPGDLVLVGDIDELPKREVVCELKDRLTRPIRLGMMNAVYRANWILPQPWIEGPFAFRGDQIDDKGVRSLLGVSLVDDPDYRELVLPSAGYHVSSIGTPLTLADKFASFAHSEYDNERDRALVHLERCFQFGVHFDGRWLIDRLKRDELGPMLERLYAYKPEWFDFTQIDSRWKARGYRGYTWLRRQGWLPNGLFDLIDRHPRAVVGPGSPIFVGLDSCLEMRRSAFRTGDHWKLWRYGTVDGRPLETVSEA
jgi:beta-1,4-mannosyl-glycoprotein beta-1,4-N-acetylglucosaminyltransferase